MKQNYYRNIIINKLNLRKHIIYIDKKLFIKYYGWMSKLFSKKDKDFIYKGKVIYYPLDYSF